MLNKVRLIIKQIQEMKTVIKILSKNLEALLWLAGLIYLFNINPYADGHLILCGFKLLGFDDCPGCGLGKSISLFLNGDVQGSIDMHPLGIIALLLIVIRILTLLLKNFNQKNKTEAYDGKRITATT